MEPKPPFPPAKEMEVLMKASRSGQGWTLPGKISWMPLNSLTEQFWNLFVAPSFLSN